MFSDDVGLAAEI